MAKSEDDSTGEGASGFGEFSQRRFAEDESRDAFVELSHLVLAAYSHRCAFTGEQFQPTPGFVHSDLHVLPIRPLIAGGPLEIGNCLPMTSLAASAFRAGQIIISHDYTYIADFSVLNADLAKRLRPDARLVLPTDAAFRPKAEHLAYHRRSVLGV